jgi:hypothetical protein
MNVVASTSHHLQRYQYFSCQSVKIPKPYTRRVRPLHEHLNAMTLGYPANLIRTRNTRQPPIIFLNNNVKFLISASSGKWHTCPVENERNGKPSARPEVPAKEARLHARKRKLWFGDSGDFISLSNDPKRFRWSLNDKGLDIGKYPGNSPPLSICGDRPGDPVFKGGEIIPEVLLSANLACSSEARRATDGAREACFMA